MSFDLRLLARGKLPTNTHVIPRRSSHGVRDIVHVNFQMRNLAALHGENNIRRIFLDKLACSRNGWKVGKSKGLSSMGAVRIQTLMTTVPLFTSVTDSQPL